MFAYSVEAFEFVLDCGCFGQFPLFGEHSANKKSSV